jgi:hypothetical protein
MVSYKKSVRFGQRETEEAAMSCQLKFLWVAVWKVFWREKN